MPTYRGKFHDAVGIGTPIREVDLELEYNNTKSGFRFPDHPGILLEPDIPHPWPSAFPHFNVDRITVFNEDYSRAPPGAPSVLRAGVSNHDVSKDPANKLEPEGHE